MNCTISASFGFVLGLLLTNTLPSTSSMSAAATSSVPPFLAASSLNFRAAQSRTCRRASWPAWYMPRPPLLVCWLPAVVPVSVVLSVSTYVVIVIWSSGTPSDSAAIISIVVRWPPPTSFEAEMACTLPSLLMTIWPVDGLPPAPWLQVCAASPIPWKIPGRTSFAFGWCHFAVQPIAFAAASMQSRMPGLLNGFFVSGFPVSLRFLRRNWTGSIPIAYAAFSIVTSSANVPFGWLTQRYGPDL